MGNNGSSSRDQQAASVCSNGLTVPDGANRGWSQSFPRELTRHRSQPTAARKVLPEPPNQRLRATDNGSIIQNGGTISGRRAPTFASSRDLTKRTNDPSFRERSGSASNLVQPCSRRIDRHCCRYRADSSRPDANTSAGNLKKFGSEPDLRCSPDLVYPSTPGRSDLSSNSIDRQETVPPSSSCYRYGKESKERLESAYKPRKKYKAPAPPASPASPTLHGDSSRDVESRFYPHAHFHSHPHSHAHQFEHHHHRSQVQPPPRRSRLFKTRAESKKAQITWQLSPSSDCDRERSRPTQRDAPNHWNGAPSRTTQHSDNDEVVADAVPVNRHDRDRPNVDEHRHHRSKLSDHGKNTLQRSISSPEFQAELIRVAKRVRDKLDSSGTAFDESAHDRRGDRFDTETVGLADQRSSRRRNEIEDRRENRDDGKERDQRGRCSDSVNVIETGNRETEGGVDRDAIAKSNRRRRTYESPASRDRSANDAVDVVNNSKSTEGRSWQQQQQNSDPGSRRDDDRRSKIFSAKQPPDHKWPDIAIAEKSEARSLGNEYVGETGNSAPNERSEDREHNQSFASTTPKTFYFGMNEGSAAESRAHQDQDIEGKFESEVKFLHRDQADGRPSFVADATDDMDDNERNVVENISLKLRPTLPKKQLEIPRFSPSAAWRLLSTLETPGPSMSTASEEIPVLFEERIERLSRPPPPFPLSLGPRSWHDKSGDSGISGDAGAGNEDSFDVSTINRMKTTVTRPTWTPQQDLGEESSSDAGVDSPPPLSTPLKYHSPRAHVFSLSLPRDEARTTTCLYAPETKAREPSAFNSLQKLKRSVSGAFGIGSHEHQRKCTRDVLDDNWLLSTSAPTSLQHNRGRIEAARISPSIWQPFPYRDRVARRVQRSRDSDDDDNDDDVDDDDEDNNDGDNGIDDDLTEDVDDERDSRINQAIDLDAKVKENDFPVILKPPSFSYLMPGGHVMYLPETNETEHRAQHLRSRKIGSTDYAETSTINREQNSEEQGECQAEIAPFRLNAYKNADRNSNIDVDNDDNKEDRAEEANEREEEDEEEEEIEEDDDNEYEDEDEDKVGNVSKRRCKRLKSRIGGNDCRGLNELSTCPEPRENVSQPKQRRTFLSSANDDQETRTSNLDAIGESKPQRKNNSRSRRFTFQSTVRQIERRRLAEKLSREAEAKERQRKGELEAMRKVEEEFQRKRAKEKASIRQQLRLFKEMEENFNLPTPDWDGSQLSRADPDGAPSSTASSPTSLPTGNSSTIAPGKRSIGDSDSTKQLRAERKDYRPKYYDWSPDTCNHLDNHRQTTVHPKIVCDIPKSSHVFVDANVQPGKPPIASNSTPKSDNYRKDFAHGTVATKTSFASSDSELSQSNTRPHSRQNRIKSKPHRPRKTLHHPTRNITVLEQRLNAVEFFLNSKNQSVVENLSSCLRHVYRLTNTVLACCSGPQAKPSNWYKLHKTISHVICIADICEEYAERIELFRQIAESITSEMQYVKYFIEYIVDFGESRRESKLVVKPNVDPLLDELNHVRRTLPELLTQMGEKDMREHLPSSVTGCNMLYLPNIGYVLAINEWNPTPPTEDATYPGLEFKFSINQVHYYKSSSAKELDETVGDIILKIAVRQNHIVQKLIRYIKKHTGTILRTIQLCAELDTLLVFYKVARDYNYVRPNVTQSKIINVVEGRHPLMECATTFVPNDIRSGDGASLIKVLTGPNSCGKSVYLKQIGLVVFMAHIGCYVPARTATIGTISRVLTQMSNTESIGLNASSFLQNLRQINVALRASTSDSIVISDELDRGTSEISGLSLVAAVLNTFAERRSNCPHVFAATHAYNVLALLPQTPLIETQTFECVIDQDESLAFLYRLINGSTKRSFAHYVARIAELEEDVVKRGLLVFQKIKQHDLPSSIHCRIDRMKRIVDRFEGDNDLNLEELKTLVRQAVFPK